MAKDVANHEERDHALLSPSGASRWMACTPSARLEEKHGGEDKSSPFAEEGTIAHELGEISLRHDVLGDLSDEDFNEKLNELMAKPLFNDEMFEEVPKYVDYCTETFRAAQTINKDAILSVEQKIDLTEYIPESFGSNDCIILADGTMEVIDLKYGKGIAVSASANKQLMLYGLGALLDYSLMFDIQQVTLTIVQPRLNNISSWTISANDLLAWADKVVRPKAKAAFNGTGELEAGDHCKFCKVKNRCRALSEKNLEIAKYEFSEPSMLTDNEIADIISRTPMLVEWANSINAYAQSEAINNGKVWPGYKLVEGRSNRKWLDEDKVENTLLANGLEEDEIYTMKLKGIGSIEKLLGKTKFNAL
ncbi:MAG: DUF2800 domain-containing protein, partial [Niameybacter sp.]